MVRQCGIDGDEIGREGREGREGRREGEGAGSGAAAFDRTFFDYPVSQARRNSEKSERRRSSVGSVIFFGDMELIQLLDDFGQPEMEGKGRNVKEDHGIEYDDKPVVDDPDFLQTEADDEGFDWFCGLREVHLSSQRRRTATFAGSDSDDNTAGESPTAEQGDRNSFNISFLVPSWSSQDQVQVNQEAEVEGVVEKEEVKMDKFDSSEGEIGGRKEALRCKDEGNVTILRGWRLSHDQRKDEGKSES
eukprot:753746-Hanusia_phi.AAC.3